MSGTAVVAVGLCTVDLVQRVESLPAPGEKVQSGSVELAAGGPAANAAVAVAALGGVARLATVLGSHPLARLAFGDLTACGVEVTDVLPYRVAPPAVSAVSVRESDGERTVVSHNAAGVAAVADVDLTGAGAVLLDGHHPELAKRAAAAARALGIPVVLDAGSWKPVLADLLSLVDVCACSSAFRSPRELTNPVVIRTAGPDPVRWTVGSESGEVVVPRAEARDTVGAGDVWHGAAALAVARLGRVPTAADVPAVIEFANRAAAVRISHEGVRSWVIPMRRLVS
ncbi:MAG: ribokinase [Actinophytocola sp.]|uniref:PfkB family carbohydrate kinase n=1 Tax=Actinophytocola sp. TaxID=1872138 RepID=UPI001327D58C|nr:PfkB family carbohydrate kinase [Actinophytocola sp.]MPZ79438.1 ribokinase [Actinophytocola sp.]